MGVANLRKLSDDTRLTTSSKQMTIQLYIQEFAQNRTSPVIRCCMRSEINEEWFSFHLPFCFTYEIVISFLHLCYEINAGKWIYFSFHSFTHKTAIYFSLHNHSFQQHAEVLQKKKNWICSRSSIHCMA